MSDRAVYAAIWQEQIAFDDDDQDDDEDDDDDDNDYDDDDDDAIIIKRYLFLSYGCINSTVTHSISVSL
jgi:hypothetical protein